MDPGAPVVVDGVPVHPLRIDEAAKIIASAAGAGHGGIVVTPNVDHLRQLRDPGSEGLREAYRQASIILADGQPLVWASHLQGQPLPARVTGADLWWELHDEARRNALSVAIIGGGDGIAEAAGAHVSERLPGSRVVLCEGPRLPAAPTKADVADLASRIERSGADIAFLGFGCPKQEIASVHLRGLLPSTWLICVGAAVDFAADAVRRAPPGMQAAGLEWLYRLLQEPRRLAGRYLLRDAPFALGLLLRAVAARGRARS